jgi:hypothetical protein
LRPPPARRPPPSPPPTAPPSPSALLEGGGRGWDRGEWGAFSSASPAPHRYPPAGASGSKRGSPCAGAPATTSGRCPRPIWTPPPSAPRRRPATATAPHRCSPRQRFGFTRMRLTRYDLIPRHRLAHGRWRQGPSLHPLPAPASASVGATRRSHQAAACPWVAPTLSPDARMAPKLAPPACHIKAPRPRNP